MFIRRIDSSYSLSVQNTTQFAQHENLSINGPHTIQKHESMRQKNEVAKEYFFLFLQNESRKVFILLGRQDGLEGGRSIWPFG